MKTLKHEEVHLNGDETAREAAKRMAERAMVNLGVWYQAAAWSSAS